jgi:2-dehydro-3-deoxygluconokinase
MPEVTCLGETMAVFVPDPSNAAGLRTEMGTGPGVPGAAAGSGGYGYTVQIGGAESNVACALAQLGIPVNWIGRVGDDRFGRLVLDTLARQGVDVSGAETDPNRPTGLYVKEFTATGTRMRYYRSGSAATAMSPALAARPAVRDARWLHLSGITPALSDGCAALAEAVMTGPVRGRTVSFDLNWRPALWAGRDPALLLRLARRADLVFVGLDEAEALWGLTDPDQVRRLIPGPRTLVVKRGAEGATGYEGGQTVRVGAPAVSVVEPTGAGDAFAAGFLAGSVRRLPLQARLGLAARTARSALLVPGDFAPAPVLAGKPGLAAAR